MRLRRCLGRGRGFRVLEPLPLFCPGAEHQGQGLTGSNLPEAEHGRVPGRSGDHECAPRSARVRASVCVLRPPPHA